MPRGFINETIMLHVNTKDNENGRRRRDRPLGLSNRKGTNLKVCPYSVVFGGDFRVKKYGIYFFVSLFLCISISFFTPEPLHAGEKLKVAVYDLEAYGVEESLAQSVSDLLRTELFRGGNFHVMERKQMEKILKEQKFQMSGAIGEEDIVELGKILSVQLMAMGSMNRLGKKFILNIRLVDVEEGKLKAAETVEVYSEDELTNGIRTIVKKVSEAVPVRGKIVSLKGEDVIVSLGSMDKIDKGATLRVQRLGESFSDPTTGKTLGRVVVEVALLRVEKIMGEQLSMTSLLEEYADLQVGDVVMVWTGGEIEAPKKYKEAAPTTAPPSTMPQTPSTPLEEKKKRALPPPSF